MSDKKIDVMTERQALEILAATLGRTKEQMGEAEPDAYVTEVDAVRAISAALTAVDELIEAAQAYMDVRGTTHGQPARNRLREALARVRSS